MMLDSFASITLAIFLLFIGKELIVRVEWLRRFSIPEALVGGVLCSAAATLLYFSVGVTLEFELDARDTLLLYFFATIGLSTNVRTLGKGGKALLVLTVLSIAFMLLQNVAGMVLADLFGMDPRTGLMAGSISLTGGVGTTLAWAPYFTDTLGIAGATEIGLATNMMGLIAACCIGGPIARYLMSRQRIQPSNDDALEVSTLHGEVDRPTIDYHGFLLAVLWLNFALILGAGLNYLIDFTPINLPAFVGCLIAGIVIRAVCDWIYPNGKGRLWRWHSMKHSLALISDICLGLFLTMALMGLRLWELKPVLGFITTVMVVQVVLVVAFVLLVVFRAMGRDYESAVICAGFGGIALGSTATAIGNMTAVTRQYGAAHKAFIVVPLVCGFVIDLANALVIGILAR